VVKIYVEGGARGALQRECRRAFVTFLCKAGVQREAFDIVASGSRSNAYRDFGVAVSNGTNAVLLVDSECEIAEHNQRGRDTSGWSPWGHLRDRDGWTRPDSSEPSQCHLMVQSMESWLVCDAAALCDFFGPNFKRHQLPQREDIKVESKSDVDEKLAAASSQAITKGTYHKGRHSFALLALIEPQEVQKRSKWAGRFLFHLKSLAP
jgi:Domain of unknown function (DUF4276)